MIENNLYDKIDNYLLGKLSIIEAEEFETQMKVDSELKEQVEIQRISHLGMERLATLDLKKKFAEWEVQQNKLNELESGSSFQSNKRIFKSNSRWVAPAIAASIVCIVVVGGILGWFQHSDVSPTVVKVVPKTRLDSLQTEEQVVITDTDEPLIKEPIPTRQKSDSKDKDQANYDALATIVYIEEDFNQTLMGVEDDDVISPYAEAVKLYHSKEYSAALKLLKKPDQNQEQEYLYLRGYTYYKLKQYDKAAHDFNRFRNYKISDRKIDAMWCEVFCLIHLMPSSKSRLSKILNEITEDPSHTYYQRAKLLQAELKLN